jgi:polysaccharide biosynthesis/export protein
MAMRKPFAILLLLIATMVASFAQEPTYRLQPEDVLRIQVYNENQINSVVTVGKDGNISAPFVGVMRAQGKTTAELEADLAQEYVRKLRIRDPKVSVTIERFRSSFASISGAAARPGRYEIRPTDTVLQLIAQGGGVLLNGQADLRRATLQRGNSRELVPIDLHALLIKGDMAQNYTLQDGDVLNVPEETKNRVMILGELVRPGTVPFQDPMTLSDAISLAGGEIRYRSKLSECLIIRERKGSPGEYIRIKANFVDFIKNGNASQNPLLEPGDIVYVSATRTPDFQRIGELVNGVANGFFILDRFGFKVLPRN